MVKAKNEDDCVGRNVNKSRDQLHFVTSRICRETDEVEEEGEEGEEAEEAEEEEKEEEEEVEEEVAMVEQQPLRLVLKPDQSSSRLYEATNQFFVPRYATELRVDEREGERATT
uniref:Uncharacterized protein n=1 Tax=Vespula pensylvanica TaxID=30213 RepID=A0A834U7U3_VESPE|nr:hypothetical protein H0235_010544 [Vespula pensylvanica]